MSLNNGQIKNKVVRTLNCYVISENRPGAAVGSRQVARAFGQFCYETQQFRGILQLQYGQIEVIVKF